MYVSYQCGGPGGRHGHDSIDVLDLTTERSLRTFTGLPLVGSPLALTPDGAFLWTNAFDACISPQYDHRGCEVVPSEPVHVLRASDGSLVRSLVFPNGSLQPGHLTPFPDGSRMLLHGLKKVWVLNTAKLIPMEVWELLSTSRSLASPGRAAFAPDGSRLYLPSGEALAVLETQPARCEPPRLGIANHWPGDGNAEDVASTMPGTLEGGVSCGPGVVGSAFRFDGRDGSVSIGRNRSIDGRSAMTVALWFKALSGGHDMGLFESVLGKLGWRLYRKASGEIALSLANGSRRLTSDRASELGKWTHVVATYSARKAALYMDGMLSKEAPWESDNQGDIRLGAGLHGLLDEVLWYARDLSPSEIRGLYRAGKNGGCAE
jgi:hypothetical protein